MCGDGSNVVVGGHFCRIALVGRSWQQSSDQRPIWAAQGDQDIARKKYRQKAVPSWKSREVTMFRDEVGNRMCWT